MLARAELRPLARSLVVPYFLSAIVILLTAVASVAGLLYGQSLYDAKTLAALMATDVLNLVGGIPFLLVSLWLARRGSARGLLLWMGSQFYIAYGYAYYAFGARFNPLFLVYVALMALSLYALVWSLLVVDPEAIAARFRESMPSRLIGGFLLWRRQPWGYVVGAWPSCTPPRT